MNLLKCQRPIIISTFNVPALNGQARQGKITAMSEKYQIDVVCIQEHRIHYLEETVRHQDLGNGWMIITSSAEKAENNTMIRGVGMLVDPQACGSLPSVAVVSLRIMVATFNRNLKTTIIAYYSPTSCSNEIEVVKFYNMLRGAICQLLKHNVILIAGDMNAQIGSVGIVGLSFQDCVCVSRKINVYVTS